MHPYSSSGGNVLFLILITVALFAALAYAVTSSTRTGSSSVSTEKAKTNAAAIIQYSIALRNAVMRVKVSSNCSDTTLDFYNPIFQMNSGSPINTANSKAPLSKACHIFDPAGGGMVAVVPVAETWEVNNTGVGSASAWKAGHAGIRTFQMKGIGTDGPASTSSAVDVVFIQMYLNRETCLAINDLLNITNPGDEPPSMVYTNGGQYINGSIVGSGILTSPETDGQPAFCRHTSDTNAYQYVHVLIER